ncbi:MAG: DUF3782 domain-containing protein, partial [Thermoproteota archaeon]|nr:DUF3782 domain-containing protein [Thermoproteota archaeon]
ILRLIKEDEEFRYAIIGLLGLHRLDKIEEAILRLTENVAKLAELQAKTEARLAKVEERLFKVEERLEEHDKKFIAIEERLEEHDKKFNAILEELKGLKLVTDEISVTIGSITRRYGKDLEKTILKIYKDQLIQMGINPDNAKRFRYIDKEGKYGIKGKEYEFDIVVSDDAIDVIEVKTHASKDDVEWFNDKVERVKSEFGKPLKRKVMVAVHIDEDALDRANELGISAIYGHVIPV